MKLYNYHHSTGEFVSVSLADKNPLEKDKFLIPANSTEVVPPEFGDDEIACFKDGSWIIFNDYRGVEYWLADGTRYVVAEINELIPKDASLTEIDPFLDLKTRVNSEVQRRIFSHASVNTQMNMTAAATAGLLTDVQMDAYRDGLIWVSQMRAKGTELIALEADDYQVDSHWPVPSAAAVALAEAF